MLQDEFLQKMIVSTDLEKIELLKNFNFTVINTQTIENLIYALYNLSKFSNQILFVDLLLQKAENKKKEILEYVICQWNNFESNRKDKFYYLIEKFNVYSLTEILKLNCHSEIKIFLIKKIYSGDLNEAEIIVEYLINEYNLGIVMKVFELLKSKNIEIDSETIKKNVKHEAKKKEITKERRKLFSDFYKSLILVKNNED
ncbi:hypothetical protein GVAV_003349 [Gurleya vavrai]